MPEGHDADRVPQGRARAFRHVARRRLGKLKGKVFRIGHLGDFNDLMLMGTLAGVEMGLELARVPHSKGGVDAAMAVLTRRGAAVEQVAGRAAG